MNKIIFMPIWRDCTKPVTFYEDLTLAEIKARRMFLHDRQAFPIVRFGVTDSGRLLCGDAFDLLHADICRGAIAVGDYDQLFAGAAVLWPDNSAWEIRFQGLACRAPVVLAERLSTWHAFVGNEPTRLRKDPWEDL